MKVPQYTFKGGVAIVNFGDIHLGDDASDHALVQRMIKEVERTPNLYWYSTGDMLNVALAASKSGPYHSSRLEVEREHLVRMFRPIAHKCLGFVSSNHHQRFDKVIGMSLDGIVARELGIPFLGDIGVMNITCGRCSYFMVMHHGTGRGKRRGAKTNDLEDLSFVIPGADIYAQGHSHSFDQFDNDNTYLDRKRNTLRTSVSHFVTTGHALDFWESYAPMFKFRPMPKGFALSELSGAPSGNISNKKVRSWRAD